jgi:hypothetical protein
VSARVGDRQPVLPKINTSTSTLIAAERPVAAATTRTAQRQAVDQFQPAVATRQLGPDTPTDEKLDKIIDDNFKAVYDRAPNHQERQKWKEYAQTMRAQGHGANHIRQMMLSDLGATKKGLNDTSDSSLKTIIEDNFKSVNGEDKTISEGERQKWMTYAKKMAAQGHDANHIKQMMLSDMGAAKAGLADTSDNSLKTIIEDNFKSVNGEDKTISEGERQKWMTFARKMAGEGHDANHIKQMMLSAMGAAKAGLADTSDNSLKTVVEDNFKAVNGEDKEISAGERQKWMAYAKKMASEGHDPNHIKQMMLSEMLAANSGLKDTTDNSLKTIIEDNFKSVNGEDKTISEGERQKWMQYAKKMAAEGKDANHIKQFMLSEMLAAKSGLTDTTDSSLKTIIEDNFKSVFGEDKTISNSDRQRWMDYARAMRAQGHDANHIKQMMLSDMGMEK